MFHKRLQSFLAPYLFFASFCAVAQDWKQVYNEALTLYQDQKFQEALPKVKLAYTLSKSLDPRNQAYTLQLLTSICLESNQTDEGLAWISEEENLFQKIEGAGSGPYVEAMRKHSLLLMQKGSYAESRTKCKAALSVMKANQQENTLTYATLLAQEGQLAALLGDIAGAKVILDQSLIKLTPFPEAGDDLLNALIVSAGIDRKVKDLSSAETKYRKLIEILAQNGLQKSSSYGEATAALSEILRQQGNASESAKTIQNESVSPGQKAVQFLKIAVDYHNQKQFDKARDAYKTAEQASVEGQLVNNTAFSIHLNFGKALLEMNDSLEASNQLKKASLLCQKLYPAGSSEYVLLDFAIADLNMSQANLPAAINLYMKAASGTSNLQLSTRIPLALNAATLLLNAYQSESAARFLQSMGADKVDGQSVREQHDLIAIYSQALLRCNQLTASQSLLQKALTFSTDEPTRSNFELALVQVLERKGELSRALILLNEMQRRTTVGGRQKLEGSYQIARLQQLMGHYPDAEKGYKNVILSFKNNPNYHDQLLMQSYNSLAVLQTQLGNYEEAERLYADLLKVNDLPSGFALTVRQNLATIYEESLQLDKARVLLEQVTAEERQRLGAHDPELAITLQNLATLYQKTGNLTSAKKLLEEAIKIDQETLGEEGASFATKIANLGVVQQQLGNLAEARKLFEQALKIHEKTLGKEHPDYMFNAYNLAVLLLQANESAPAALLFSEVSSFYRRQIRELFPAMSEKEKAAYYNKINEIILAYLDFAVVNYKKFPELQGELYDFRLSTKALLFNASAKIRNVIMSSGDTLLLKHFTEWQKTKEDLGKLSQLAAQQRISKQDQIHSLRQRADELEKLLSEKSTMFNNETQQTSVDWKKVKSTLLNGQAAIEMIRLRLNLKNDSVIYAALILRPELASPEIVLFPDGKKMEGQEFYFYRNSIKYQIPNDRSYRIYWEPLEEKLSGVNTVFLSSDGVYNKINVMTLLEPKTGKYLVETKKVKLVNNTRELLIPLKTSMSEPRAALFGRPDFGGGSNAMSELANGAISPLESLVINGIADLPGTEEEVTKIGSLLRNQHWEALAYLGDQSTETAIKLQKNLRILHIATHGFFIPSEADDEHIMLAPDMRQLAKNPLLRSGLLLSGAQKYMNTDKTKRNLQEDGILTAYEVLNLNLDKTELVILSACETGAGEVKNGEGVFGLQRAFLLAGASNLVMSLWKVDDSATQELMVEFYQQWLKSNNKYEAFHNAMLFMKAKWHEPYYWGSFAMIGFN